MQRRTYRSLGRVASVEEGGERTRGLAYVVRRQRAARSTADAARQRYCVTKTANFVRCRRWSFRRYARSRHDMQRVDRVQETVATRKTMRPNNARYFEATRSGTGRRCTAFGNADKVIPRKSWRQVPYKELIGVQGWCNLYMAMARGLGMVCLSSRAGLGGSWEQPTPILLV